MASHTGIPANETPSEHPSAAPNQKPTVIHDALEYGKREARTAMEEAQKGEEGLYHDIMDHKKNEKTDWKAVGGHAMQVAPMGAAAIIGIPMLVKKWGSIIESNKEKAPSEKVSFFGRIGRLLSAVLWTGGVCIGAVAVTNLVKSWREKREDEKKKNPPKTTPAHQPTPTPAH